MLRTLFIAAIFLGLPAYTGGTPTDAAHLRQVIALKQAGQTQQALQTLGMLATPEQPSALLGRLHFVRALLAMSLAMPDTAREDLLYVFRTYPPLADYAGWHLLQHFATLEQLAQFGSILTELATRYPFSVHLPEAYLLQAQLQVRLGHTTPAQATLAQLCTAYPTAAVLPAAVSLRAELYEASGELVLAAQTLQQLGESYPTHALATQALQRSAWLFAQMLPEQRPVPAPEQLLASLDGLIQAQQWQEVDRRFALLETLELPPALATRLLLTRATVAVRRQALDQARTVLQAVLQQYPQGEHMAETVYLLGRVEQRQGKHAESERQFRRVITEYTTSSWAAEAMWVLAQRLEDRQDFSGAETLYFQLAQRFPTYTKVEEELWQLGWRQYVLRRYDAAADLWQRFATLLPQTELLPQVLYWQARAAAQRGQGQTAERLYQRVLSNYPFHYYGLRAAEQLRPPAVPPGPFPAASVPPTPWTQPPPVDLPVDPPAAPSTPQFHLIRVQELQQLAMYPEAAREIRCLGALLPDAPATRYFLGALLVENQDYLAAFRQFGSMLTALRAEEIRGLPHAFWTMLYPKIYWDNVAQQAQAAGVNPYLVLSVMRQESAFQPTVVSSAGAVGLMQLMPATARMMSSRLGLEDASGVRLETPSLNITLGTRYFASLWQRYGGNIVLALAAYNAGPGRADTWRKQWSQLPMDEFVEHIPFRETRLYVKLVLRNLLNYERLYKTLSDG